VGFVQESSTSIATVSSKAADFPIKLSASSSVILLVSLCLYLYIFHSPDIGGSVLFGDVILSVILVLAPGVHDIRRERIIDRIINFTPFIKQTPPLYRMEAIRIPLFQRRLHFQFQSFHYEALLFRRLLKAPNHFWICCFFLCKIYL